MLEMVERSICFNPNSALYKQAQVRGWEVVVERKDVVYHL
jgi:phosphoserine phosphatase